MSHHEDEKTKKIRERNKRNWVLFKAADKAREQSDVGAPEIEIKPLGKSDKKHKKIWTAQVVTIRKDLDGRRREATDRWNRFAGTGDGGGRGR